MDVSRIPGGMHSMEVELLFILSKLLSQNITKCVLDFTFGVSVSACFTHNNASITLSFYCVVLFVHHTNYIR